MSAARPLAMVSLACIADPMAAGVDEAGRGPLAGPVYAAAVILDLAHPIAGIDNSKALAAPERERLAALIRLHSRAWAIGRAEVEEIDRLNILRASLLAMKRAVELLDPPPSRVLVDGNCCPEVACPAHAVVEGDARVVSIAAASILAKVARDREMLDLDALYPGYGFARHKGYATREHLAALRRLGTSPVHRRSFAPVKALLPA